MNDGQVSSLLNCMLTSLNKIEYLYSGSEDKLENYSEFGSDRRQNLHNFIQVEKLEIDKLNTMKPSRKTKQNNKTKQK